MSLIPQYELLDFGRGRKLERFGDFVLDRPAPGTEGIPPAAADLWRGENTDARYDGERAADGDWVDVSSRLAESPHDAWQFQAAGFRLSLRLAPSGQVGVFPEQAENWKWISEQTHAAAALLGRPPKVLNLFAYTGGSTLAAASAGAEVAHVDAAKSVVQWARINAKLSQLAEAPIRWLVEDAARFVEREVRRGATYDGLILDPPTYGRGGGKRTWRLESDLVPLLQQSAQLGRDGLCFLLLTAHTPGYDAARLAQLVDAANFTWSGGNATVDPGALSLGALSLTATPSKTNADMALNCGHFARYGVIRK